MEAVLRSTGIRLEKAILPLRRLLTGGSGSPLLKHSTGRSGSLLPRPTIGSAGLTLMKSEQPGAESRGQTDGLDDASNINIGPDHKTHLSAQSCTRAPSRRTDRPFQLNAPARRRGQRRLRLVWRRPRAAATHVSEVFGGTPVIVSAVVQQDPLAVLPDGGQVRLRDVLHLRVRHVQHVAKDARR
uniref:Uncharacterized protein n=1 Tax=Macrostomum lignano TaxID=282301 RepID=A0A1I8FID0_9PLAT